MSGITLETADAFGVATRLEAQAPNAWIRFLMERGPREVINIVVGDVLFPVNSTLLRGTCKLFHSHPQLLSRPNYVIRAAVSPGVFQVFREALGGAGEVTPENYDKLCALAQEFGFHSPLAQLMLPEMHLDPEFPVDDFLLKFLNCCWTALADLGQHYVGRAVFSLSVALHGPHSPLDYFDKFGHYAGDGAAGNVLVGGRQIALGLVKIFGERCWAKPSTCSACDLGPEAAVVLRGTLIRNGTWLAFDRSMFLVRGDDGALRITNDHLFLREPNPE
jgi:hypothetical protein